jgi:hypothetical protein
MNIIDADGHIVEKDSDLRKYLPEPHSKRAGSLRPSDGLDTELGGRVGGLLHNDIPTRLKDMDQEGKHATDLRTWTKSRTYTGRERMKVCHFRFKP